jgi:hypothetical protein
MSIGLNWLTGHTHTASATAYIYMKLQVEEYEALSPSAQHGTRVGMSVEYWV